MYFIFFPIFLSFCHINYTNVKYIVSKNFKKITAYKLK